jgi:hypothetical protein
MGPQWLLEEDPTVKENYDHCAREERAPDPTQWWQNCPLTDIHIHWVMMETPVDRGSQNCQQHGVYHHVERPCEAHNRIKKGKGHDPPFVLDKGALADICQLQALWLTNNDRVPPAFCQDRETWKLNIIDIDVNLWLKAMAPSDKKEFC